MKVHFNFRKIEATAALKSHIEKRVAKFDKFITYPVELHFILGVEKNRHTAEIELRAEHKPMVATCKADDMYEAIDLVCHKMEAQLKKARDLKKGHAAAHKTKGEKASKLAQDVKADLPHQGKSKRR